MSDLKDIGYPAFPVVAENNVYAKGMTLRDYIATAAMQGYIAATPEALAYPDPEDLATVAYKYADAMLAERERTL
jgi:hypothetical protein